MTAGWHLAGLLGLMPRVLGAPPLAGRFFSPRLPRPNRLSGPALIVLLAGHVSACGVYLPPDVAAELRQAIPPAVNHYGGSADTRAAPAASPAPANADRGPVQ
jgi:hypothetical protein